MKYRAITSENFLFLEIKQTAKELIKTINVESIKKFIVEKEIINHTSDYNLSYKALIVEKRLKSLDNYLIEKIANGSINGAKFIILYSIIKNERFFQEFMDEIIYKKYSTYDYKIKNSDILNYFEFKGEQSEVVKGWKDNSKKKMKGKLVSFLKEAGYLEKDGKEFKIVRPIIHDDIIEHIKKIGDSKIIKSMLY